MVTASFLTMHLLIDWPWGEVYFAQKLLFFDLAINESCWQRAIVSATVAVPCSRIFNADTALIQFDPGHVNVRWRVLNYGTIHYLVTT